MQNLLVEKQTNQTPWFEMGKGKVIKVFYMLFENVDKR